jgi:hypothetical protein
VSTDEELGVVVTNILDSSDVYRRGMRYGDELVAFGGRPITTVNGFKNVLGIYPRGWRVPLSYRNADGRQDVYVRLAGVHSPEELIKKVAGPQMPRIMPPPKKGEKKQPGDDPEQPEEEPQEEPGEEPKDQPPDGEPQPMPIPIGHQMPAAPPMPEHVKKLFQEREGYANYYFNELNRTRVWQAFSGPSDFSAVAGTWSISGQFADGGDVQLVLGEQEVTGTFEGTKVTVDPSSDLSEQRGPEGSGGLLAALHLWQRLLTRGPEKFGEVYYLGTAPMLGHNGLVDVLVGAHDVVETRFMFDPQTGRLVGMELVADSDDDPCEVYFEEYRDVGGYSMPHRIKVLYGDEVFGVIDLLQINLPQAAEEKA